MSQKKSTIYNAFSVRKYELSGEEKTEFLKVGIGFPLKNKKGFSLKLSSLPISGELVVMEKENNQDALENEENISF